MSAREHLFERVRFLPWPRDRVFPFFSDARNLERITPAYLDFRILTPAPIAMGPGTLIDYRLRLFGIPFHWRTRIESFDAPRRFTDTQDRGPYALWHHTHEFHEAPGGTLMVDRVRYAVPLGPLGEVARRLFVERSVGDIFRHRNETLHALLAGDLGPPLPSPRGPVAVPAGAA